MSIETTNVSVKAFFESYRGAIEGGDAPTLAGMFAYPCHITSDQGEIDLTSVADEHEWHTQIEGLLDNYRAIDVYSAHILKLNVVELSPRLVQAQVRWALYDSDGRQLYEFGALYTLAQIDAALKITAIAHDELPLLLKAVKQGKSKSRRPRICNG
ncbi:MAG: hypothetical protein H7175_01465 [Burkholderiales bacterium]|nr:hypothetical protein [Anaerolineae bacterium]